MDIKYNVSGLTNPILLREFLTQAGLSKTLIKKAKPEGLFVNGERVTGVTIMKTDVGIDNGDMIKKGKFEISEEDTLTDLFKKLCQEHLLCRRTDKLRYSWTFLVFLFLILE